MTSAPAPLVVRCRSCGASIVWLETAAKRSMPTNADTVQDGDREFDAKRHRSHFADCAHSNHWRKPR